MAVVAFLDLKSKFLGMNTTSPIVLNLNITGQLTIDPKELERLISGLQIQTPVPNQPSMSSIATTDKKLLTRLTYNTKETAELLGTSTKTVYRLIERGLLKSSSALRHKRIARTEIERFLKETTVSKY